jgi:hypothetical protein
MKPMEISAQQTSMKIIKSVSYMFAKRQECHEINEKGNTRRPREGGRVG